MKRIRVIFFVLWVLVPSLVLATDPQSKDLILYEGEFHSIPYIYPLESLYTGREHRPKFEIECGVRYSLNLRGYDALWEVRNGNLYLKDIDSCVNGEPATLNNLFTEKATEEGVLAEWFSGDLTLSRGVEILPSKQGEIYVYLLVVKLTVQNGKIQSITEPDHTHEINLRKQSTGPSIKTIRAPKWKKGRGE